jgi:hypothetical protein
MHVVAVECLHRRLQRGVVEDGRVGRQVDRDTGSEPIDEGGEVPTVTPDPGVDHDDEAVAAPELPNASPISNDRGGVVRRDRANVALAVECHSGRRDDQLSLGTGAAEGQSRALESSAVLDLAR